MITIKYNLKEYYRIIKNQKSYNIKYIRPIVRGIIVICRHSKDKYPQKKTPKKYLIESFLIDINEILSFNKAVN